MLFKNQCRKVEIYRPTYIKRSGLVNLVPYCTNLYSKRLNIEYVTEGRAC